MSQVPPPFSPSSPPVRKDKSLTVVIFVILGVIVACGCGVVALSWAGCGAFKNFMGKVAGPIAGCAINFEAARDAVLDYAKDHGGRLPKAETWQDDVRQYVKRHLAKAEEIPDFINAKTMKPDGEWGCYVNSSRSTGMAFNIELSGKLLSEIKDRSVTPLLFEIEKASPNAAEKYKDRPASTAPTIMGESRGWVWIPIEGEMRGMEGQNGNWKVNTNQGRNDPQDPDPEDAKTGEKF